MKIGSVNVLLIAFLSQSYAQGSEIKRDAMERQLDQIHSDIDSGMEKYFEAKENEHFQVMENAQMKVGEAILKLRDLGQDEEAEALAEEIGRVFDEEEFVERVVNEDEDEESEVGEDEDEDSEIKRDAMERQLDQIHSDIDSGMEKYFEAKENEDFEVMENAQMEVGEALVRLRDLGQDEEAEALAEEIGRVFDEDNEDTQVDVDELEIKRDVMERQLDQIHSDIDSGMEKYFEAKENGYFKVMENAQVKVGEAIHKLRDLGQDEEADALDEEVERLFTEEHEESEVDADELEIKRDAMERQLGQIHSDIDSIMQKYLEAKENGHFEDMENAQMKVGEAIHKLRELGCEQADALEEEVGRVFTEEH